MEIKPFISLEEAIELEDEFREESILPSEFLALAGLENINGADLDFFWRTNSEGDIRYSTVRVVNKKKWLLAKIKYGI